jgi:phosphoribosylformylglycinamidine synthase PurS subunit
MKCGIKIMPREVILDTQGRVVETYLVSQGFKIQNCRVGKFIEIDLESNDKIEQKNEIEKMMSGGLYNPLTEKYEICDV